MVQEKAEYAAKIRAIEAAAAEAERLGHFVRMLDLMVVGSLGVHVVERSAALLELLSTTQGLLKTSVTFDGAGEVFAPTGAHYAKGFQLMFAAMRQTYQSFGRIINTPFVEPFLDRRTHDALGSIGLFDDVLGEFLADATLGTPPAFLDVQARIEATLLDQFDVRLRVFVRVWLLFDCLFD